MILEFTCSNYKSIKEEINLSMLATTDKELMDTLLEHKNNKVLPIAEIYGANGAGKTNVINSLGYFKFLVVNSNNFQPGDAIPYLPHKLNQNPSKFQMQLVVDGNRYAYGFSVTGHNIINEYLYHFKNNKQAKVFYRDKDSYSFGKEYAKELKDIKERMSKENKLFLSLAANWSNNKDIVSVFLFIKDKIVVNSDLLNDNWLNYTLNLLNKSVEYKENFLRLLNNMGTGITDIDIDIRNVKTTYEELPLEMPEELKMLITKSEGIHTDVKVYYDDMKVDLKEESRGVNKLFEIGGLLLDILVNGKVLVYDEIETSLHPIIVRYIIELFNSKINNINNSQLIFTTHDTNLLDLDLVRRDQIWLTEKINHSTNLYSLSDLKNIRLDENIESGYIRGKYGAIPFMGSMKERLIK